MPPKGKKPTRNYDVSDQDDPGDLGKTFRPEIVSARALRYVTLREEAKVVKKDMDELSVFLKKMAADHGDKTGNSFVLEVPGAKVQQVGAVKNSVDHAKAIEVLRGVGGEALVLDCTRRVLDEKALEIAFQKGLIGMDDIDSFTTESLSYSLRVDRR